MRFGLPKLENKPLKYGYSNARVKGMKGLLLRKDFYRELVKVRSAEGMLELLQRTYYKEPISELSLRYGEPMLVIELAAGNHFAKVAKKIRQITPEDEKSIIDAILKKWDILNLKTVINGKRAGKKWEEVMGYLVPAGSVKIEELEKLFASKESDFFNNTRKTAFGRELLSQRMQMLTPEFDEKFREAVKCGNILEQLNLMLDAYWYAYQARSIPGSGSDIEKMNAINQRGIDAKNISIIARLKKYGVEDKKIIKRYIIPGGLLKDGTLEELIDAKSIADMMKIVKRMIDLPELKETSSLSDLEIAFEKSIAEKKVKIFYRSILSIGALVGFLFLKEEEMHNLRKIARAKEFSVPEEKALEMMIFV